MNEEREKTHTLHFQPGNDKNSTKAQLHFSPDPHRFSMISGPDIDQIVVGRRVKGSDE